MRVLHVIPSLSAVHGGPSIVLPVMERALAQEGISVETVTTDDEGLGKRNEIGDGKARRENGITRRYFPKQTEFYKVSLPMARWLKREVGRFDLIHIHALFSFSSLTAARAAKQAGVPYIIRPLGVLNQYGITQRRALLKRFSLHWLEAPALRNAAAVHFTMEAEREEAELLGIPFKSVVIPLGMEPQKLPLPDLLSPPYVLFLSRIDPKKNLESLLDAWRGVVNTRPDWRLVIAGSGGAEYLASLKGRCASLGITGSVDWAGQVQGEEKARLLVNAGIFTLPSFSENFGIAAAEAMQAGKACLFTAGVAVGAWAARVGAAVVSGESSAGLAIALAGMMDDPTGRLELGRRAAAFAAAELSAEVMGKRLVKLYRELVPFTA
jgi:glycosyltransferase involved in cell wall biosynthesis